LQLLEIYLRIYQQLYSAIILKGFCTPCHSKNENVIAPEKHPKHSA